MDRQTSRRSAGLLLFRRVEGGLSVFLVHPGGRYFRDHDLGTWTIPQGEIKPGESLLQAACLRFAEEVGLPAFGPFTPLTPAGDRNGNVVHAWGCEVGTDPLAPGNPAQWESLLESGENQLFPARAAWFEYRAAKLRINPVQSSWIDELVASGREAKQSGGSSRS
jgi:predicted NUDIX family NTP pyrophosphohydrolase